MHQDREGIDPNCIQPGAGHPDAGHPDAAVAEGDDDALREPAEYTDLLNTDWIERGSIERGSEAASVEDEQGFDFDIELSGTRDSELDEEGVNLFDVDVGSLLTSSPADAGDFEAGPLDPLVADGLIDPRPSLDGELSEQAGDELGTRAGLHDLSLPRGAPSSGLDLGDEAVGDDESFPAFDHAPGVAPPDGADDAGQEGIAEEAD